MVEKKLALVIGNNYPNSDKELKFAVADAVKIKEVLENKNICGFDEVRFLLDSTSMEASSAVEKILENADNDLVLIYFSGHGKKDFENRLCLLFNNTEEDSLVATSLTFDTINKFIRYPSRKSVIIVLDCCYSGVAGIRYGDTDVTEDLKKISGSGTLILTSTGSIGSSFTKEDKKLGHGVFTYYLIEGLETGNADKNCDGYISIDDLYNYAFEMTIKRGLQSPKKEGSMEGTVLIGKNPLKIREKEYELKKKRLFKEFGSQLPPSILSESQTILRKYYKDSSSLEQTDVIILGYLESLLKEDLLPEKRADAIQNYSEAVQHLKGISTNERQSKQKGTENRLKKEVEEPRRQREEAERREREEEERKRKEEKARKARKEAEEKAIKEKEEQERLRQHQEEEKKQEEFQRQRKEAEQKREEEREIKALDAKDVVTNIADENIVPKVDFQINDIKEISTVTDGNLSSKQSNFYTGQLTKLPSKIDEIVEEQFGKLPEGLVKFIFNKKMKVDVSEKVEAYLAKDMHQINEKIEQYYFSREDGVSSLSRKVKITSRMRILLEGANFDIKETTPPVQQILNNEATTWRWTVKPLKSGIQKLFLSIDIIIKLPQDIDRERHITMLEEEIEVKVNPTYFLECNWKWILGTMITIILAILFKGK